MGINNRSQARSTTLNPYLMVKLVSYGCFYKGYESVHRQLERCGSYAQRAMLREVQR